MRPRLTGLEGGARTLGLPVGWEIVVLVVAIAVSVFVLGVLIGTTL